LIKLAVYYNQLRTRNSVAARAFVHIWPVKP